MYPQQGFLSTGECPYEFIEGPQCVPGPAPCLRNVPVSLNSTLAKHSKGIKSDNCFKILPLKSWAKYTNCNISQEIAPFHNQDSSKKLDHLWDPVSHRPLHAQNAKEEKGVHTLTLQLGPLSDKHRILTDVHTCMWCRDRRRMRSYLSSVLSSLGWGKLVLPWPLLYARPV